MITGPDGYVRTKEAEARLNILCASVFGTAAGIELMSYIKSITTERVAGPEVSDGRLRHLEGSRYLAAILSQRTALGHTEKSNVRRPAKSKRK